MEKALKTEVIKSFARDEKDTGSPEVQVGILSSRINELTEHLRLNKKDKSTQHGLLMMVSRRRKLLKYLNRKDHATFLAITEKLNIRRH